MAYGYADWLANSSAAVFNTMCAFAGSSPDEGVVGFDSAIHARIRPKSLSPHSPVSPDSRPPLGVVTGPGRTPWYMYFPRQPRNSDTFPCGFRLVREFWAVQTTVLLSNTPSSCRLNVTTTCCFSWMCFGYVLDFLQTCYKISHSNFIIVETVLAEEFLHSRATQDNSRHIFL